MRLIILKNFKIKYKDVQRNLKLTEINTKRRHSFSYDNVIKYSFKESEYTIP